MPEAALIHDSCHSALWGATGVLKEAADWLIYWNAHFFEIIRGCSQSSGIFGLLLSINMKYH